MFYELLKKLVGVFFNALNLLLAGNLPPFACSGVIVEEQDRYLVIRQPSGSFAFPGGFMRWREHPAQTAQRECEEETGLRIRTGNVIGYYSITSPQIDRMSTVNIIFQGEVLGGELRDSIEGHPCWLAADELRGKLTSLHKTVLEDYLRYRTEHRETSMKQV